MSKNPIIILVDGLSSEINRESLNTQALLEFLSKELKNAPSILKFILTLRTDSNSERHCFPLRKISLDLEQSSAGEHIKQDLLQYVSQRCEQSHRIADNVSVAPDALESGNVLDRFAHHIVSLSKGSMLYVKLILNLVENGLLVLKSGSFKVLPQSLSEIFLLMFNMKFPTTLNFEKHKPIFNAVLASQAPLTLLEIYQTVNAGLLYQFPSWSEFMVQFKTFKDLLRKRQDSTYVFFHPALRDWLLIRSKGESQKFICDIRVGHSYIALKLSRLDWPLQESKTLELAYHIVHSELFDDQHQISKEQCQALWITQSSQSPSAAFCNSRNIFQPDIKVSA